MEVGHFNTVTLQLNNHEAWLLSEILSKHPNFFKTNDECPFGKFARELNKQIESNIKKG